MRFLTGGGPGVPIKVMNRNRVFPIRWLLPLSLFALGACTAPSPHVRVVFQVDDAGHCQMNGQALACDHAGAEASSHWLVAQIHAVLLPSPHAPQPAVQALDDSLRAAHVAHVQFGDPSTFKYDPHENGFHI